ncbi:C-type lectin domain family 2 member B-like [Argopecten irradians]|uniref:C-type lectin domain family 2 member B-like n=1 Tax=Argopecten irradians TaxID=31199 RepID=UPI003718058B
MCKRYRLCVKIHHDREQLTCDLMMVSAEEGTLTSLIFLQDVPMGNSGCLQDSCSDLEMCVDKKDGNHVCIQVLDIDLPDVCPTADWMPFNGKCYYYDQTKTNANKLPEICQSLNSTLIRVDDEEVQYFLKSKVDRLGLGTLWMGLKKVNGEWVWGPEDPATFVDWSPGEPDKSYEYCAFIAKTGWGNSRCSDNRRIGCEKPFHIPPP